MEINETLLPVNTRRAFRAGLKLCIEIAQGTVDAVIARELITQAQAKRNLMYKHANKMDLGADHDYVQLAITCLAQAIRDAEEQGALARSKRQAAEISNLTNAIHESQKETAWMRK